MLRLERGCRGTCAEHGGNSDGHLEQRPSQFVDLRLWPGTNKAHSTSNKGDVRAQLTELPAQKLTVDSKAMPHQQSPAGSDLMPGSRLGS